MFKKGVCLAADMLKLLITVRMFLPHLIHLLIQLETVSQFFQQVTNFSVFEIKPKLYDFV